MESTKPIPEPFEREPGAYTAIHDGPLNPNELKSQPKQRVTLFRRLGQLLGNRKENR